MIRESPDWLNSPARGFLTVSKLIDPHHLKTLHSLKIFLLLSVSHSAVQRSLTFNFLQTFYIHVVSSWSLTFAFAFIAFITIIQKSAAGFLSFVRFYCHHGSIRPHLFRWVGQASPKGLQKFEVYSFQFSFSSYSPRKLNLSTRSSLNFTQSVFFGFRDAPYILPMPLYPRFFCL